MRWGLPAPRQGLRPLHPALHKLHIGLSSVDIEQVDKTCPGIDRIICLLRPLPWAYMAGYVMPL